MAADVALAALQYALSLIKVMLVHILKRNADHNTCLVQG
jgi:hypothetical protein